MTAIVSTTKQPVIVVYTMDKGGPYEWTDALNYATQADFDATTQAEREAEMTRRHENWKGIITAPRPYVPPLPPVSTIHILRLAQEGAVPDGTTVWGGYWDYLVEGISATELPEGTVYAAERDAAGVYRTLIVAPAAMVFEFYPDGWNPTTWPALN